MIDASNKTWCSLDIFMPKFNTFPYSDFQSPCSYLFVYCVYIQPADLAKGQNTDDILYIYIYKDFILNPLPSIPYTICPPHQ